MVTESKLKLSWWKMRSKLERRLIILLVIIFLVLILLIFSFSFILHLTLSKTVCTNKSCVKAAAKLLESIDPEINPCDDFYAFACGNYIHQAYLDNTTGEISILSQRAARQFEVLFEEDPGNGTAYNNLVEMYASCMNLTEIDTNGLYYVKKLFDDLGGWPVLMGQRWDDTKFNWKDAIIKLRRHGLFHDIFFALQIHEDALNTKRNYLRITPPSVHGNEAVALRKNYEAHMITVAEKFGAAKQWANYDMRFANAFKIELGKLIDKYPQNFSEVNLTLIALTELRNVSKQLVWEQLLNDIMHPVKISPTDLVFYNITEYMRELHELLEKTPRRVQANYIIWETIKDLSLWLPREIRNERAAFTFSYNNRALNFTTAYPPRSTTCVSEMTKILPFVAQRIYAEKYATDEVRNDVRRIVRKLKYELAVLLKRNDWMDGDTKEFALRKLHAIRDFIGGKMEDLNMFTELSYANVDLYPAQNYLEKIMLINKAVTDFYFTCLNKSIELNAGMNLLSLVHHVNAYYATNNLMVIPAALLQGMIFDLHLPNYVNYAGLGHLIGHELTHAFSQFSRNFGLRGEHVDWWSSTTEDNYINSTLCLVEQYENYTATKFGINLNGVLTLDENIADQAGLYMAYKAMMRKMDHIYLPGLEDYTPQQIFWIANARFYCDPHEEQLLYKNIENHHSVSSFRVMGPLMNSKFFADDFNCPLEAPMNPADKCNPFKSN